VLAFFVLYTRSEIADIIRQQPTDLQPTLLALAWILSRGNTSLVQDNHYGLLQVNLVLARQFGYIDPPEQLLEPEKNVTVACQLLAEYGLLAFLGRINGCRMPEVLQLSKILSDAP
jgi:hypothetical protein